MQRHEDIVLNQIGTPIPGVTVTVRIQNATPGSGALATIYSDDGSTVISGSAVTTDTFGRFFFFAPDGKYDLTVTGTGITTYILADTEIADLTELFSSDTSWKVNALDIGTAYKLTDQTTFLQLEGDVFIFDNDAGAADFVLKRSQSSGAGQGNIIRFRTRNDNEDFIDGAQINGGLEFIVDGSEQGVLDYTIFISGTPRTLSMNGNLASFTPSVTGIWGLGTTTLGFTGLHLEGSAPVVRMEDTDETLPAGAWRMINDTDILQWQHNTAAAGDFSTRTIPLLISATDVVTTSGELDIGGDLNHDGTNVGFYATTPVAQASASAALTGTPGTADGAMATISGSGDDANINNNFQEVQDKVNEALAALRGVGLIAT